MTARRLAPLLVVLVLAVGCSGDDSSSSSGTTTSTTERTTATTAEPSSDAVVAAYRSFWDAFVGAGDPMNPASPELAKFATGDELAQVRSTFTDYFARNLVIRGDIEVHPEVRSQAQSSASLHDCYLDRTHLFHAKTGVQQDPPDEPYFEVDVAMQLVDGQWKVARIDKRSEGCTP